MGRLPLLLCFWGPLETHPLLSASASASASAVGKSTGPVLRPVHVAPGGSQGVDLAAEQR